MVWLACAAIAATLGCSTLFPPSDPPGSAGATQLSLEKWQRDSLHCAVKECKRLYRLQVPADGELKIEVYSPIGPGEPDFGLVVRDSNDRVVATSTEPLRRPRRISVAVDKGDYTMRIYALGANDSQLNYDVVAKLSSGKGGRAPAASGGSARPKEKTQVAPPPPKVEPVRVPAPVGGVTAEVLDLEVGAGDRSFVLLDRGEPDGLRVGMRGSLVDSGEVIGEVEVMEVFPDGSRAALLGPLVGEIGIDSKAIFTP